MQALQVASTEAIATAIQPQVGGVHSSPSPESFGLKWQQQMEASGSSPFGQFQEEANAASGSNVIKYKVPTQTTAATSSEDSRTKAADTVGDTARDQRVVTSVPTRSGPDSPTPIVAAAKDEDIVATLDRPAATLNAKYEIPGQPNVIASADSQKQASAVPPQPIPVAQGNIPVAATVNSLPTAFSKSKPAANSQSNVIAGVESQRQASVVAQQPIASLQGNVPVAARADYIPQTSSNSKYDAAIPSQSTAIVGAESQKQAPIVAQQPIPSVQGSAPAAAQANYVPTAPSKPKPDARVSGQSDLIAGVEPQIETSTGVLQPMPAVPAAAQADYVPMASSKPKHEAKIPGQSDAIAGADSQKDLSAVAVAGVPVPLVEQNVPIATQVDATPNSQTAIGTSSTVMADLPSKVGSIGRKAGLQPAQTAGKSVASGTLQHSTASAVGEPAGNHTSESTTESGTASPVATAANAVSTTAGDLHANLLGTPGPVTPTPLSAHPSSLSLPDPTNAAGTKEMGSPTVLASGPTQLDVGVFDGTHGWLQIRAELGAGGGVNASLTASTSAHESLRAAVPAMTNFLGTEAVSVSSIAVHRFGQDSHTMSAMSSQDQPNGDTRGHQAQSEQAQAGPAAQQKTVDATDQDAELSATDAASALPGSDGAGMEGQGNWTRGYTGATSQVAWPSAVSGGMSGSWLNVSA